MVVTDICGAGHESAGEISRVGPGVTDWKVGDRVALECGIACSQCDMCIQGEYNTCRNDVFFLTPPVFSFLKRYHIRLQNFIRKCITNIIL